MKDDAQKEFLKFLYESGKTRKELDPDKRLQLAKNLIDAVRHEEHHIIVPVDVHIQEIIADLDKRRYEEYLVYRTEISQQRTKGLLYDSYQEDEDEDSQFNKRTVYVIPTDDKKDPMTYHLHRNCERQFCKEYEEKVPCRLCFEKTEDTLKSSIGSKMLGFAVERVQYHDEDCQVLLSRSEQDVELRTVCLLCQEVEDIEEAIKESRGERATGSRQETDKKA
jgi:uncharacterized protein (DUF1499 family)